MKFVYAFFLLFVSLSAYALDEPSEGDYQVTNARCLAKLGGADIWQDCTSERGTRVSFISLSPNHRRIVETKNGNAIFSLEMTEVTNVDESSGARIVEKSYFRPIRGGFEWVHFTRVGTQIKDGVSVRFYQADDGHFYFGIIDNRPGETRTLVLKRS